MIYYSLITELPSELAARSAVAAQDIPVFVQTTVAAVVDNAVSINVITNFAQVANGVSAVSFAAIHAVPSFAASETAGVVESGVDIASIPVFGQIATITESVSGQINTTFEAFTQVSVVAILDAAIAIESILPFEQIAVGVVLPVVIGGPLSIDVDETIPAFMQNAQFIVIDFRRVHKFVGKASSRFEVSGQAEKVMFAGRDISKILIKGTE